MCIGRVRLIIDTQHIQPDMYIWPYIRHVFVRGRICPVCIGVLDGIPRVGLIRIPFAAWLGNSGIRRRYSTRAHVNSAARGLDTATRDQLHRSGTTNACKRCGLRCSQTVSRQTTVRTALHIAKLPSVLPSITNHVTSTLRSIAQRQMYWTANLVGAGSIPYHGGR